MPVDNRKPSFFSARLPVENLHGAHPQFILNHLRNNKFYQSHLGPRPITQADRDIACRLPAMVSTTAFRETFVLILFGIVLVPIAAKRAHDARGYWQTFSKEISSSFASYGNPDETFLWTSSLEWALNDTISIPTTQQRRIAEHQPPSHASRPEQRAAARKSSTTEQTASSAPEGERAPFTIRFQVSTSDQEARRVAAETTTTTRPAGAPVATATPAPDERTPGARTLATKAAQPASTEPEIVAKESEASRGRWTLIWMCSAITAVAVFMSSC